jgi:hypothetical protein
MRGVATTVAALAVGVFLPVAAAGEVPSPSPPIGAELPALVVRAVPAQAGVRPVQLVFQLRGRLSCTSPTVSLSVGLSPSVRMPATLPSHDVLVDGVTTRTAAIKGHVVALTARPRAKACGPFAGDAVTVTFMDGARLGNPLTPGSYSVWLRAGVLSGTATLLIR